MNLRPLSEGNRLQRAYARWAARGYARMAPEVREQAELVDRYLYSRAGAGFWLGLLGACLGTGAGLRAAGLPLWLAAALALVLVLALPLALLPAWMQPEQFLGAAWRRKLPRVLLMGVAGGLLGFGVGHVTRQGAFSLSGLAQAFVDALGVWLPAVLGMALVTTLLMWGVAHTRRSVLEGQLASQRREREREAAERQVAQARLQLLQAQIQPHFLFNTLSALQHWVDEGDPRAAPLLRALTGFLRRSTEHLGREAVRLGDELETVRQYLEIMQARLGGRLRFDIEIDAAVRNEPLPPGLVLTLVENAVQHGVEPQLAGAALRVVARREAGQVRVSVHDDGAGLAQGWREGTGLANTRARLAHHAGAAAGLELLPREQGSEARMAWPATLA